MTKGKRSVPNGANGKVEFLRHIGAYPGEAGRVRVIETHFSWVFLTATHAYKMKKPVRQAAMDYRTIAGRMRGCRTELRLNRRLAPAAYLGVMPLRRKRGGELSLGDAGRIVDWLVAMRRLPAACMLDAAMMRSDVTNTQLRALVGMLGNFYAAARPRPMPAREYLRRLGARSSDNAHELLRREFHLPAGTVQELIRAQLEFIRVQSESLGARGGRLVEGHGDLRPEHVYLGSASESPAVIDCLEFDAALRRIDPVEEVAALALECTSQGSPALAWRLLNGFRVHMQDDASDALVHFYMSQRAATRAKLAAWHLREPALAARFSHWRERAEHYLRGAQLFARMAVQESSRQPGSRLERYRPALDEGPQGLSRKHSLYCLPE